MRLDDLLPGDIIFLRSTTLLGRLIRWGQRSRKEGPSRTNHVALVVGAGNPEDARIVEAMQQVRTGTLLEFHGGTFCEAYTPINVSADQRGRLAGWALTQVGRQYGYGQLILQLIDAKIFRGHNVFRRLAVMDPRPICSRLVATAYRDLLGYDFGVPAYAADPDTMMDFCDANPDKYVKIWEGYP
jgi:cell wall-associated NlpC family hydrolase